MRCAVPLRVGAIAVLALLALSCDKGLAPAEDEPSATAMAGLITYAHWPPPDSLVDLRIVLFRSFPPGDIFTEVLGGRAIVYPSIGDTSLVPFYVDSLRYFFELEAGTYAYVVVAQQFGPDVRSDWRVVGQYDTDTSYAVPSSVTILPGETLRGIDIRVDFLSPPPAPF